MNNNLTTEVRVNKLGVPVTKHVRVTPKDSASASQLPSPQLAKQVKSKPAKAPTSSQLKSEPRAYTASHFYPDAELTEALDIDAGLGVYRFRASEADLYRMFEITDIGNALALLQGGVRSPDDATMFLSEQGLERLLISDPNLAALSQEALSRRIPPEDFMREYRGADTSNPHFMDAVETSSIAALKDFNDFAYFVSTGEMKLADIKEIGAGRIKSSDNWVTMDAVLKRLANGSANYTTKDVRAILDKYGRVTSYINNAFRLADFYGGEFAASRYNISPELMDMDNSLQRDGVEVERAKSILAFTDEFRRDGGSTLNYGYAEIIRFHDAGVSAEDTASGRVTLLQLDGIEKHGITPSVSEGWL